MFPEEIPRRLIRMFSFVGDIVLDPFLGSGTTSRAARNLGRNSIGYEVNPDFIAVIRRKVGADAKVLFADDGFEFAQQEKLDTDFVQSVSRLPYVFHDPVAFDKKTDPRKLQFGSRICLTVNEPRDGK
jgi:hypothetical protein